ncbi:EAL domain-containing protein [Iodobacter sp. HSC-16F04]|uniref:EAL domain-containing protein n=1 Tax=Iodobacter violaceini TaxID=3044271 RepID=A0ABX0KUR4_9NEIS|nr:bifunctional diguanylate cyclase/phosphodiesterase [Iodobacter violacea]NHQ88406.1 EAL domain-containing protein [Iodobacter violacea]
MSFHMMAQSIQRWFRQLSSARIKILLVLLVLNLLLMVVFTLLMQWVMCNGVRRDADTRLSAAVRTLPMLLPADYLPRALSGAAITQDEYLRHVASLNRYCQVAGLRYLYAFKREGDKVSYLVDSASPAELVKGSYGPYQTFYADPGGNALAALKDGLPRTVTLHDAWGEFRTFLLPVQFTDGSYYLLAADIDNQLFNEALAQARWQAVWMGLVLFAVACAVCFVVAHHFSAPLATLSRAVRRMASGDFGVRIHAGRQDELGSLARAFNALGELILARDKSLRELAFVDSLSGLANRAGFLLYVEEHLRPGCGAYALVVLNVNDFHFINEYLGYQDGDTALRFVAGRLNLFQRPVTKVARLGGNTFALLLERVLHDDVLKVLERVDICMAEPLLIGKERLDISATSGVALFPEHGFSADSLLRNAEVALCDAKRARRSFAFYDPEQEAYSRNQLTLMGDLREALAEGHLLVYYQPKVKMVDGVVHEAEALVRWQHPERGFISPGVFIPFAEQTGKLRAITEWVVHDVLTQAAVWLNEGLELCISVNVGVSDVEDASFVSFLEMQLAGCQVPPQNLCLEITETGVMRNPKELMRNLEYLRAMGVKLSIDDFGTGYSSFAYLAKMPVHELKIDQSFVMSMNERFENVSIVRSIIELGHILGLSVIAEGVETEAVWQALAVMGCDEAQGYLIAAPMPAKAFSLWCRSDSRLHLPIPLPNMAEGNYTVRHFS